MTSLFLVDLALVALVVVVGLVGGWCVCWYAARRRAKRDIDEHRLVQDVLAELGMLIENVSADVDEHGDCLAEVNEGLAVAVTEETKLVAAALAKLVVANNKMRERLGLAETQLQQQSRLIEAHAAEARTDSLTRLVNRRAFDDELKRAFAAYRRQGRSFSVVLLEMDPCSWEDDRVGSHLESRVLARVAATVRDNAREMDLVARRGEEQFAILLPGTTLAEATAVAKRICEAVAARRNGNVGQTPVTLSAGAAQAGPADSVLTLVARAGTALERSRAAGGNRVHFHDGSAIAASGNSEGTSEVTSPNGAKSVSSGEPGSSSPETCQAESEEASEPDWVEPPCRVDEPPYLCARAEFRMAVARRLAEWDRGGSCLSVVLVRVDDYRGTIAEYGFDVEPCLRSALWHLIVTATRDMDLVGLEDQETFAMLLPGANGYDAVGVAERLRESVVQRWLTTPTGLLQFAVSTGVTEAREGDNAERLLARAEETLLAAVASGGNCSFFDDGNGPRACQEEAETVDSAS